MASLTIEITDQQLRSAIDTNSAQRSVFEFHEKGKDIKRLTVVRAWTGKGVTLTIEHAPPDEAGAPTD